MTPTPEELAYENGRAAGKVDARLDNLESNHDKTAKILDDLSTVIGETTLALQLLASESKSRAEADRQLREADKTAREETATAIEKEKDNAAKAIREEKETTAIALSNEANKSNIKWLPRNGWSNYIMIIALFLGAYATFYITYHK